MTYLKSLLKESKHNDLRGKIALAISRQSKGADMAMLDMAISLIPPSDRLHQIAEIERTKAAIRAPSSRE